MTSALKVMVACLFVLAPPPPRYKDCDPWHRWANSEITYCVESKSPGGLVEVACQYERWTYGLVRLRQKCNSYDELGRDLYYWECRMDSSQGIFCTDKVQLRLHRATKFHADFQLP